MCSRVKNMSKGIISDAKILMKYWILLDGTMGCVIG